MTTILRNLAKALLRRLFRLQAALYVALCTEPTRLTVTVTQHLPPPEGESPEDEPGKDVTYREWLEQLYAESPSGGGSGSDDTRLG